MQGAGRRPGGAAAEAGSARLFRRSRNGLRPVACGLPQTCAGAGRAFAGVGWGPGRDLREGRCRGRAAGPAAEPPRRAKPACFGAAETACGRSLRLAANLRRGSKNPSPGVGRGEVRRDQPQTLGCWWLGL